MESHFIKSNCQGLFSPSYVKCDECLKLENIFMDYPLIDNISKMPMGIFGLYHTPGNLESTDITIKSNIYSNNPNLIKFKISTFLYDDYNITTDILNYHQCNNELITVSEILFPLENQPCEEVLKAIVSFYKHHCNLGHNFLHGSPDISHVSVNSNGDYRISVSNFSSAEINRNRYIFGLPGIYNKKLYKHKDYKFKINNLWSYRRRDYEFRSMALEIHCFIASLELSNLPRGHKWNSLIKKVFQDNYLGSSLDFSNFYYHVSKLSLHEKIFDIIDDSLY